MRPVRPSQIFLRAPGRRETAKRRRRNEQHNAESIELQVGQWIMTVSVAPRVGHAASQSVQIDRVLGTACDSYERRIGEKGYENHTGSKI